MEVEPFTVELATPLETAAGAIREREGFLVRIGHAGTRGLGEAAPLIGWTETRTECRDALARAGEIADHLDWGIVLAKTGAPAARHALALALLDARGRAAGEPLYRTLGGTRTEAVPVNATLGVGDPETTAEAAADAVAEGFNCLKLKVGGRDLETDLDRVRRVREAVDARLRVDANGTWDRGSAERAVDALADLGVSYVEQPLPAEDLDGLAALRGRGIEIAVDESLAAYDIEQVLDAGAADVAILKPMVLGGTDLAREVALRAREAGVEPVVSTTIDSVVARTGAVHLAASIPEIRPCGLATASMLRSDLAPDPATVADGTITVPQNPGLGLQSRP
jgi:o-succinylbenzoate synthase